MTRLQRVAAGLLAATDAADVARAFVTALTGPLASGGAGPVAWCQVWLLGSQLELAAASDAAPDPAVTAVDLSGPSVLAQCAVERTPIFATGLARDATCPPPPGTTEALISAGIVPILRDEECLGVVVATYPVKGQPDAEEQAFLRSSIDLLALALQRSKWYEEQAAVASATAFLAESTQIVSEATGLADTLDRLAKLALTALGDICLIDVVGEEGAIERKVARHRDPAIQTLVDRLSDDYPVDPQGSHPALDVIRTGETRWSREMSDEFLRSTTRDDEHFRLVKALGFRSYLAVPLRTGGETLGSLILVSSGRPFGPDDVALAEQLSLRVSAVVNNARLLDATHMTSHILQRSLLPRNLPHVDGVEIETRYLPATRGLEVGGDCYDILVVPSGRIGFMIGDVAGHDRDAAAAMGQLRSAARALAGQVAQPADLIAALQWSWDLLGMERMATAVFGRLDQQRGTVVMASAGHHPPLLVEPGSARFLPVQPSTPLGAPETLAVNWEGHLVPGQVLLLYTDGVLEGLGHHTSPPGGVDAMDRLAEIAADGPATANAVCGRVVAMLPDNRTDDVALLALELTS